MLDVQAALRRKVERVFGVPALSAIDPLKKLETQFQVQPVLVRSSERFVG